SVLDDEVPDWVRDMEDERAGVLYVVKDALHLAQEPGLTRPAAPHAAGAERMAESGGEADACGRGEGVEAKPFLLALGQMAVCGVRAVRDRLGGSVEGNRHDHDRDASHECERRVRVEAARDDVPEPLAS